MRALLVDWMVEVQENFEVNHESLYLGVKLVDLYLSKHIIRKENLQLVGITGLFIACKYDVSLHYVRNFFVQNVTAIWIISYYDTRSFV